MKSSFRGREREWQGRRYRGWGTRWGRVLWAQWRLLVYILKHPPYRQEPGLHTPMTFLWPWAFCRSSSNTRGIKMFLNCQKQILEPLRLFQLYGRRQLAEEGWWKSPTNRDNLASQNEFCVNSPLYLEPTNWTFALSPFSLCPWRKHIVTKIKWLWSILD